MTRAYSKIVGSDFNALILACLTEAELREGGKYYPLKEVATMAASAVAEYSMTPFNITSLGVYEKTNQPFVQRYCAEALAWAKSSGLVRADAKNHYQITYGGAQMLKGGSMFVTLVTNTLQKIAHSVGWEVGMPCKTPSCLAICLKPSIEAEVESLKAPSTPCIPAASEPEAVVETVVVAVAEPVTEPVEAVAEPVTPQVPVGYKGPIVKVRKMPPQYYPKAQKKALESMEAEARQTGCYAQYLAEDSACKVCAYADFCMRAQEALLQAGAGLEVSNA